MPICAVGEDFNCFKVTVQIPMRSCLNGYISVAKIALRVRTERKRKLKEKKGNYTCPPSLSKS